MEAYAQNIIFVKRRPLEDRSSATGRILTLNKLAEDILIKNVVVYDQNLSEYKKS